MKLDKKNLKIIYELDKNARIPYSRLSRKVGLSQESVRYRVNRLVKENVINKFLTILDISKLGFTFYKILLKLHNVNEDKIRTIIKGLSQKKEVVWLTTLNGNFDVGFVIKARNIFEFNRVLEGIEKKYNNYISKKVFSVNVFGDYLNRSYLVGEKRIPNKKISYSSENMEQKINEKDIEIIKKLTKNARLNAVEISEKLNISPDSVLQRIRKLEKDQIITKYTLVLNHDKINQIHNKVLIYLNNFSPERISSFLKFCGSHNQITYIIKALGYWSYELDIEAKDLNQYQKVVRELTSKFSDIIQSYDTLTIQEIHKYNFYP